jgi:hypothetical protein
MKNYFSDVVHDVIGNDPVIDQFDVSYPANFYKTSQDNYITGTLLKVDNVQTVKSGKLSFSVGERGSLFSKLQASSQPPLDSTYGSAEVSKNSSYAERLVPWIEKVSNSYRITQCVDEKERFYDSCLPSIKSCFASDNANFWVTSDDPLYWLSPYGNVQTASVGYMLFNASPITSGAISNNSWTWSFPFDVKYSNAERLQKSSDVLSNLTTKTVTNWYPQPFTSVKDQKTTRTLDSFLPLLPGKKQINTSDGSFRVDPSLPANGDGSYRILIPSDIDLSTKIPLRNEYLTGTMSDDEMIKFLFGFGDLNNIAYTSYSLNESEDESNLSSSYFTGFELVNWSEGTGPFGGPLHSLYSASFNGAPILATGSSYFNSQFDQSSGNAIVKWVAPAFLEGTTGYPLDVELRTSTGALYSQTTNAAGYNRYNEYPWMLLARENFTSASFLDDEDLKVYNYVSQSVNYSYADGNTSYARGSILTSSTGIYWASSSSPSRHWVLGSYLSASIISPSVNIGDITLTNIVYRMPDPVRGGKTISSQRADITASLPWKLSYSRAISGHISDYFYSSFTGMPGFPASVGGIDLVIEKLQGVDVPFEGTNQIQVTPQVLTDFTSSLYPPGEYQIKFSYVKTGVSGSSNRIDRAFIDNVNILTFPVTQLTGNLDPPHRIGYSHYPDFRQVIRDTRTATDFPGSGFTSLSSLYKINRSKSSSVFLQESSKYQQSNNYGAYEFGISPVIRGWKYGIYNGLPAHSRIIFRRNRYGQFRDMLEQRQFTKFINADVTELTNVSRGSKTRTTTKNRISSPQEGPVTVKFVTQAATTDAAGFGTVTTNITDPMLTTSQNLSTEVTSSLPFFDGESRSRLGDFNPDGSRTSQLKLVTAGTSTFTAATNPTLMSQTNPNNTTIL